MLDGHCDEFRWEKDGVGPWGHPPQLYPTAPEFATDETRAANLAASLLQVVIELFGEEPTRTSNIGDLRDAELARKLEDATGVPADTIRVGFERLRLDGFRLVHEWRTDAALAREWTQSAGMEDDEPKTHGLEELWPHPAA